MKRAATVAMLVIVSGCAEGDTGEPHLLESGLYQLSTIAFEGDCVLEDAISSGSEFVGKVKRAGVVTTNESVRLEVCDDFFENDCKPEPFIDPLSLLRTHDQLFADDPSWQVPDCTCTSEYRGSRSVEGLVVSDGHAELNWTFELPAAPSSCTCSHAACSATVSQRLSQPGE